MKDGNHKNLSGIGLITIGLAEKRRATNVRFCSRRGIQLCRRIL